VLSRGEKKMNNRSVVRGAFVLLAASVLVSTTAHGQVFRAYLASDGSDANPCTLVAPCRLLPAALTAVASGGEIWMLDSANYNTGTVVIDKSASILAVPGAVGSLVAINGGPAISITANGIKAALRNVVIGPVAGATAGTHGVHMTGASNLTIEGSLIRNMASRGILVVGSGVLKVSDSTLRDNGSYAIELQDGASGTISSTRVLDNGWGIVVRGTVASTVTTATVTDTLFSGGNEGPVAATYAAGATARITATRCTIQRILYAFGAIADAGGTAVASIGDSLIAENTYAWYQGPGTAVYTLGNNQMLGNLTSFGTKTLLVGE